MRITGLLVGAAIGGPWALPAALAQDPPNVLFISIDDLNDWVGVLGGYPDVQTPNLDQLAQAGTLFTNAHCTSPACNPSRTALLTGIHTATSGITSNQQPWRYSMLDVVTLPQHFMAHGYEVLGGDKIYHNHCPDPASWHEYAYFGSNPQAEEQPAHGIEGLCPSILDWAPMDLPDSEWRANKLAVWAAAYLSQEHDQPFFLAVGTFKPHLPWYTPAPYFDMYPLADITLPPVIPGDLDDVPPLGQLLAGPAETHQLITQHDAWEAGVQAYLATVSFVDAQVGIVLGALYSGPHANDTIVVLWSDQGFHLGEKDHWTKFTLWEESTRVPLIVVPAGDSRTAQQCSRAVSLLDLYPTLIELCGLPPRPGLEGRSLVPLLNDPQAEWDHPVVTTHIDHHAVRSNNWRYIRYSDGTEELYDHSSDPSEWANLADLPEYDTVKGQLAAYLPGAVPAPALPPAKLYVDASAAGLNNGQSWTDAYTDLQDALTVAANAELTGADVEEIWVAAGTYTPAGPGGDRRATFRLVRGVQALGGFAGWETHRSERDPVANVTILSGDLNGDDGPDFANNDENSYHVVTSMYTVQSGTMDGFTITGGNANGPDRHAYGGGLYNDSSKCTIRNSGFVRNSAIFGGAVHAVVHHPWAGGNSILANCWLIENVASQGGAVYSEAGNPKLFNCRLQGNVASGSGGGMYCTGGVRQPWLMNCLIMDNAAVTGGGLYTADTKPVVVNCTFKGNSAASCGQGSAVFATGPSAKAIVKNSIVWDNVPASCPIETVSGATSQVVFSCIQGGWAGSGNIEEDPLFADADGRLSAGSPCIDAGCNSYVPSDTADLDGDGDTSEPTPLDLDGNPRFADDPDTDDTGSGTPPIVDMGSYEFGSAPPPGSIVGAASVLGHGGTDLPLDLTANDIEPRADGVLRVEFEIATEVTSAAASVTCVNNTYSGSVATSALGTTVTVEFAPALPDRDCCEITLTGDAEDSFSVRTLKGDLNRDGSVNTTDASQIKLRFGQDAATAGPQYDYNTDGTVNTTDFSQVKLNFGKSAAQCP